MDEDNVCNPVEHCSDGLDHDGDQRHGGHDADRGQVPGDHEPREHEAQGLRHHPQHHDADQDGGVDRAIEHALWEQLDHARPVR